MDEADFNSWIRAATKPIGDTKNDGEKTLKQYKALWEKISKYPYHKWAKILINRKWTKK